MAEENIVTNIVANANFSSLIGSVNKVNLELSQLKQTLTSTNKALAQQAAAAQAGFASTLRSTQQFSTHFVSLASDVDKFGKNLDSGKLRLKDYYQTWQQHSKTAGGLIRDLAKQQVQLQNAILQPLGRNAEGLMQYNVHIPRGLDRTKYSAQLLKQEMQIFNKVIQDGGVQLINWGKNTQWAGRQLTVGLTLPIAAFGKAAADAFKAADEQLVRLTKVYGGVAQTSSIELAKIRKEVSATAKELASAYGASYKETIALAADIAATGKQGNELLQSTRETTRLSVLGEVSRQDAMKATLAIQSGFKQNTQQLAESINFLNAVENQTSTSLGDLIEAIPKAGPVVKSLGGSVQDLALYLTAMKEGGINASEGANAIKSSLASLINPTKVAKEMFSSMGIDLGGIVTKNAGNLTATILDLQGALDTLDPLSKSKAIEQLFGKFQFARMSALFENLGKQGSQTLQVLDLMKASSQDLANIAGRELSQVTESASGKYRRALEGLKADLAGVGEQFLNIQTFFINLIDKVVNLTNKLPGPIKTLMTLLGGFTALVGPVIMLTGVLANFLGYIIKGGAHLRAFFKGAEGWKLLTPEILAAQKAGTLIEQTFYSDAKAATALGEALSYVNEQLVSLQSKAKSATISSQPTISTVAGSVLVQGATREVNVNSPYLSPKDTRSFSHPNPVSRMTDAEKAAQTIFGIVPGAPIVNQKISDNPQMYMETDLPKIKGLTMSGGVSTGIVSQEAAKWHSMTGALAMQSQQEIALLKKEVESTGLITQSLSDSYQALLPQMTELTSLAASESAVIVQQLQAGKISVDQARSKIMALNAEIEIMMGQAATGIAAAQGRTISLTQLPIVNQPAFDPVTGKANMKELTRPGRTRDLINKISSVLGVKTYGAPYSIETTIPKRFNTGGAVYLEPGGWAPKGTDTVPAMLTPGEFVVNREQTQRDPKGLEMYNSGQAVIVPVKKADGGIIDPQYRATGGHVTGTQYFAKQNLNRIVKSLNPVTRSRDITEIVHGIKTRGSDTRGFISQIGDIPDPVLRQKYLDLTQEFANSLTRSKQNAAFYSRTAKTVQSKNISDLNSRFVESGLSPLPYVEPRHDTHLTVSKKLGRGKTLVSNYVVDYTAASNLSANQNNLRPVDLIRRDLIKLPGLNKYRKQLRAANIPISQWDEAESAIDNAIKQRFEAEAAMRGITVDQLPPIGDRPESGAAFTFTRDIIPEIEKVLTSYNPLATFLPSYTNLKQNKITRVQAKSSGGLIQYFASNMVGRIVKALSKEKVDKLTAKWKPKKQFYPQGMQYTLGNQDPLHGPLQIGREMHVGSNSNNFDPFAKDPYARTREIAYNDPQFARMAHVPGFPIGTLEERGKYITRQYMEGNYGILNTPGAIEAMRAVSKKFTGTLYRGILLSKNKGMNPLPQHILDLISQSRLTGDYSRLLGKEFIMRRSSWSADSGVASMFAPGHAVNDNAILIEAAIKNRNVVPASDMFPNAKFSAPFGQKLTNNSRSEKESIFGGKFRIVSAENGKLKLETVVDGALAGGGPVSGGRPYLVGENGPELFIPRNSGGIIPGYAMGGHVTGTQYFAENNEQRIVQPNTGGYMKSMIGGQLAGFGLSTVGGKMFGGAGQMGGYILGQMGVDMLLMAKNARTATSETTLLTKAFNFFVKMPGPVKLIAALLGVGLAIKTINDKINEHRRIIDSTFAPEEATITKLGLQYKTVGEQIDAFNKKQEKLNALAAAYKYSSTTAKGGINLTQKELDILKKSSAKEFPTEIKAINMASLTEAPKKIEQLKAIFVSSGLSVEKATNLIYALILNSNKAKNALDLLGTEGFGSIKDKATAAASTLKTYNDLIKEGNKDQLGKALDTSINAYQNLTKSLIGTKDTAGKVLTSSQAYAKVLEQIGSKAENNVAIGKQGLENLLAENSAAGNLANTSDTLKTILAKVELSTAGIALNFNKISGEAAIALSIVVSKQQEILRSATGPFATLAKDIAAVGKTNADQIIKNATASADALKKEIDLHNKNIDRIKAEADARKNALDQQNSDENINLQIKAKQLEYQDKLAAGDMSGAAQAQIAIQQLVGSQQLTLAKRAIDTKANADISKEQATIDLLNAKIEGLQNTVNKAQKTADAAAKKSSNLQALMDQLVSLTLASDTGPLTPEQQTQLDKLKKDLISASGGKYKALVDSLSPTANKIVSPVPGVEFNLGGSTGGVSSIAKDTFSAAWNASKQSLNTTDRDVLGLLTKILGESGATTSGTKLSFDKKTGAYVDSSTGTKYTKEQAGVTPVPVGGVAGANKAFVHPLYGGGQSIELLGTIKETTQGGYFYRKDGSVLKNNKVIGRWYNPGYGNPGSNFSYAQGGLIHRYEPGGKVSGPGTGTSDSIPAWLSDGEYVFSARAVANAGGPDAVDSLHNALKKAEGGPIASWMKPKSPYNSKNQPTGNPRGRYWGELERLYQQSPLGFDKNGKPIFNNAGKDPWGGIEIPGLPFNGKVANFSDYFHQLAEQPRKSSGPGMGLDRSPDRYAGSGASMGGIGNGAYGFGPLMLDKGGPVKKRATSLFDKSIWEKTANFFGLPQMGKTALDLGTYGGPQQMIIARMLGMKMRSSMGDNVSAAINLAPIPILKILNKASKAIPKSILEKLVENGVDVFSKTAGLHTKPLIATASAPKSESLILDALKMATKKTPGAVKDLLGYPNQALYKAGRKVPVLKNHMPSFIKPMWNSPIESFKRAYQYTQYAGKSFNKEIVDHAIKRKTQTGAPKVTDDYWDNVVPTLHPMEAFGELFGLLNKSYIKPITTPIKNKLNLLTNNAKLIGSSMKSKITNKESYSDYLYRNTPIGSIKALIESRKQGLVNSVKSNEPGFDDSLSKLFENQFFHGGVFPEKLTNRLEPGSDKITGNIFNFDLFTTMDKIIAREYAVGKNAENGASIFGVNFNKVKNTSKIWDMRGGAKSLWSQNKKAYTALEKYLIKELGLTKTEARTKLIGERVPGIAKVKKNIIYKGPEDRDPQFSSMLLNKAFTKSGIKGSKWLIDTIVHTGGALQSGKNHPVIASLDPEKMVKSIQNVLPKDLLRETFSDRVAPGFLESTVERLIHQYAKYGKTFPVVGEGIFHGSSHLPKSRTGAATGGYVNPSFSPNMSTPAFAMGGLAGPKYTIPNNTVSVGKPGISGYNKGGSVNHYNVGGMVINTQPGQDEKMIATMVVDMLDQKNMMRSAMSGRGRNN